MSNLPEQMHGTAVATTSAPGMSTDTLDSNDVRLPRLKLAQLSNTQVEAGVASYGDVLIVHGADDLEPTVLAKAPKDGLGAEVIFYVLSVQKGYSFTDANNGLQISRDGSYPNLADVKGQDPKNVRRTFDYLVVVPEYPDLPVKFLMHGAWGGQAAKSLNTRLVLTQQQNRAWHEQPFKLQVQKTKNDKGSFLRAIVAPANLKAADVEKHQAMVQDFIGLVSSANVSVADDAPAAAATPVDAPSLD